MNIFNWASQYRRYACALGLSLMVVPPLSIAANTGTMRNITPQEMVDEMGIGTNLGNTLDVRNANKTYWGNPETTEAIIDGILSRGYGTIRLPVTWEHNMGGAPDYIIEQPFLNRVEEIAGWALENDVYVIINTHHDGDWIVPTYTEINATTNQLYKVWTQIAEHFKDYGDHLIFETLNEPRVEGGGSTWGEWSGGTPETRECVNISNKACVDAIRATGGNNALRKILVPTHAANAGTAAMNAWQAPNGDTNVIVSLHAYSPYWFCLTDQDPDWGTAADQQDLDNMFNTIYNTFIVGQGRAVVMGEWGEQDNGLGNEADRARHAQYYAQACIAHGICPVYWDDGGKFKVYDRHSLTWHAPTHADAILSPYFGEPFDLYELTEELQLGRMGDDDGDGENNFLEFATGGDATSAAVQSRPIEFQVSSNGTAVLTSSQRMDRDLIGLQYTLESSDDLTTNAWQTLAAETIATNAVPSEEDVEELQHRFAVGAGAPTNRFIRLRVEEVVTP